jgi:hypothetical protein
MKRNAYNLEHQIQLKKIEIDNYTQAIKNYPIERLEKFGKPYLQKLNNELQVLMDAHNRTDKDNK